MKKNIIINDFEALLNSNIPQFPYIYKLLSFFILCSIIVGLYRRNIVIIIVTVETCWLFLSLLFIPLSFYYLDGLTNFGHRLIVILLVISALESALSIVLEFRPSYVLIWLFLFKARRKKKNIKKD